MTTPDVDFQPGDRFLENFRIEGELGRGGMGEVYLAVDEWMEREVAIKLISRKYADRPDFVERFRRETKALAKLEHRNIVRLYSAGRAPDGRLYMIMERLPGVPLRKIIETARRLDPVSAIHYGIQIVEGVSIAHAKGILHRDIKPENILVGPGGHVWVLDFGLAKSTATTVHTDEKKEMGTTRYMPPELINGHRSDERSDLYAIGIVLYEMLAGRHPYPVLDTADVNEGGAMGAHLFTPPTPLTEIVPECPEPVWRIVARCLAKDREARHANAEALAAELRALLRDGVPADHPIAQQIAHEQAEAARRKMIEARGPAPQRSPGEPEPRGDRPLPDAPTAPLPQEFVPQNPSSPSQVQAGLGLGHTIKMVSLAGSAPLPRLGATSEQASLSDATVPLPSMTGPVPRELAPTTPLPDDSVRAAVSAMEGHPSGAVMPRMPLASTLEPPRMPLASTLEPPRMPLASTLEPPRMPMPSTPEEPPGALPSVAKAPPPLPSAAKAPPPLPATAKAPPPLPSAAKALPAPAPSTPEAPAAYSFTKPGQPPSAEVLGAPVPAANASTPSDLAPSPSPTALPPPEQKKRRSITAPIFAGFSLALVAIAMVFFLRSRPQPASPTTEAAAPAPEAPAPAAEAPAPAAEAPAPAAEAPAPAPEAPAAASASSEPSPPPPAAATSETTAEASAPPAPATAPAPPVTAAVPAAATTSTALALAKPSPPKSAPVAKAAAAPPSPPPAAPAPARTVRRLWLEPEAPAKPAPAAPAGARSKGERR